MNFWKILSPCLLIVLTAFASCRKTAAPTQQPAASSAPTVSVAEQYHHPEGGSVSAVEIKYFKGSIGNTLGLQMKLTREGEKLTGSYFYQKVGTRIDLRGSIDKENILTLEEFDSSGKQTGVFKGFWNVRADDGLVDIAGNWTRPDGQKKTAFSLHQEPIQFSGGVEVIARQIKESNKKLRYEIDAEYPQLTGLLTPNLEKFNQSVRSVVTKKVNDFKKEMATPEAEPTAIETSTPGSDLGIGYTIALAKDDLISIQFDIGGYSSGAAHPNSYSEVLNFDLKNGRPLKLSDLFQPGSKYLQTLASYSIQDLQKQSKSKDGMLDDASIETGAGPSPKNYRSWTITRKGLGIAFDAYQVGPYAAGPQYVLVPYSALKELIKPDGPIGEFAR